MASPEEPRVAGVILAAGVGSRFESDQGEAPDGKLLVPFEGEPLVVRVCRRLAASPLDPLIVVLGHRADRIRSLLDPLSEQGVALRVVVNERYSTGQASSVKEGLAAVPSEVDAVVFVPADQPFVDRLLIEALIERHCESGLPIVVPRFGNRRGAPVLFARDRFSELRRLDGDEGGRQVARRHPDLVAELELQDERPLLDLDTFADLETLRSLLPTSQR